MDLICQNSKLDTILKNSKIHVKVKVSYYYKLTGLVNINWARSKKRGVGTLFKGRSTRELERGIREIENYPPLLHVYLFYFFEKELHVYLVARKPPRVAW